MAVITNDKLRDVAVSNQMSPPDGPKAVPVLVPFSSAASWTLDYSVQQAQARLSCLQALFIDNSAGAAAVQVQVNGTGQTVVCPPAAQAYLTVLCMNPIRLIFNSSGTVDTLVYLLNFPVSNLVWKVA